MLCYWLKNKILNNYAVKWVSVLRYTTAYSYFPCLQHRFFIENKYKANTIVFEV